ncbi:transglycosylase family protein [Mycolicibacterium arseniciresistens]|uniref:transglycosylase family protein n=1 Tax=Mycolicibacterium arseniciresistens TaxID=3062257 RepID=UPI003898FCAB
MTVNCTNGIIGALRKVLVRVGWLAAIAAVIAVAPMLLSPATANADSLNWDAIAECESGGNWSTNTGNGHYGGLQFKPSTWAAHGGMGNPATAPRSEQIRVAERVLAKQGIGAWPKCGPRGGAPAIWTVGGPAPAPAAGGCDAIRTGSVFGLFDLRRLCSSVLSPLTSLSVPR